MGVKALPRIASQLIAGGRPPSSPSRSSSTGRCRARRPCCRRWARSPIGAAGIRAPGDHARRAGRRAARAARLAGDAAAARPHRGGHARPRAGERTRGAAAGARRRRSSRRRRSARSRCAVELPGRWALRPAVRDLADRRRRALPPPARRPRAGGRDRGRDRPGHGAGAARARDRGRRRARARRGRGADRGARGLAGAARVCRPRGRGPRRPARRAARARRARSTSSRSTRPSPEPLDDATRARRRGADYCSSPRGRRVRFFAAAGGSLSGPRLVSIGPATSAELRGLGAEPDLEADPHTPDGLVAALLADAVTSAT